MSIFRTFGPVLAVCGIALGGCATPQTQLPTLTSPALKAEAHKQRMFVLKSRADDFARLQNVAYQVVTRNSKACKTEVAPNYGFHVVNLQAYDEADRAPAKELWNVDETLRVTHVVPASPAGLAGLATGDRIVRIDGKPAPRGDKAVAALNTRLNANVTRTPVKLVYRRGDSEQEIELKPVVACKYPVVLSSSIQPNAFTDGKRIVINRGLLRIAEKDDELALVVAHELGHITMRHFEKKRQNELMAGAGGLAADIALSVVAFPSGGTFSRMAMKEGRKAFSREFEQEADYVGMYYMVQAGYDASGVESFWHRMGGENPHGLAFSGTHPSGPERFLLVRATHNEIAEKRLMGDDLAPNIRPDAPMPAPRVMKRYRHEDR